MGYKMTDCEFIAKCLFFNDQMKNMSGMSQIYKDKYCKTDNSKCARYIVCKALDREKVPATLFPNMVDKARKIIAENKLMAGKSN